MAELREDSITGTRVIVAPARGTRPHTAADNAAPAASGSDNCPFCEGHEHETPPEVARTGGGEPNEPGWRVRVVPNKYPIVGEGVDGAHEVVILSPDHNGTLARLPSDHAREVMRTLRDRAAHQLARGCRYVSTFVNQGKAAGASIAHPHAQLVSLDFVPPTVERVQERFSAAGTDLVVEQIQSVTGSPLAIDGFEAAVWCPPASTSAYAVRCALPGAGARFDRATDDEIAAITDAIQGVLRRLTAAVGDDAPYNVVVNSAARDDGAYHWWVDVLPRVSVAAGFEFATGLFVCSVAPEDAAQALGEVS